MIERLAAAGFAVDKDGADEPYWRNVYFIDPNGIEVEFVEYGRPAPAQPVQLRR